MTCVTIVRRHNLGAETSYCPKKQRDTFQNDARHCGVVPVTGNGMFKFIVTMVKHCCVSVLSPLVALSLTVGNGNRNVDCVRFLLCYVIRKIIRATVR